MKRPLTGVGLRAEDMHGFIVGSMVSEVGNKGAGKFEVMATSGLLKTDYIQLDSLKNAWSIAGGYR